MKTYGTDKLTIEDMKSNRKDAKEADHSHYFTGKPCKRGHISPRTVGGTCVICMRLLHKKWYDQNCKSTRVPMTYLQKLERNNAYYHANKDALALKKKAWYQANKDEVALKNKAYKEANKEQLKETARANYEKNRKGILARRREYRLKNREKINQQDRERYWKKKEEKE